MGLAWRRSKFGLPDRVGTAVPAEARSWRIDKLTQRWPFGTALDSDSARCTNRRVLATPVHPYSVLAGVLPIRHAFDDDYSNVGNRLVFSPDRPSSRIGCDPGTRAEPFQSTVRQRHAKAARMEPSLFRSLRVREDSLAIDGIDTGDHDPS